MLSKSKSAKSELRSGLLQQLKDTTAQQRADWSLGLQRQLKTMLSEEVGYWGAYQNFESEPQLDWKLVSEKIKWCFPKINIIKINS